MLNTEWAFEVIQLFTLSRNQLVSLTNFTITFRIVSDSCSFLMKKELSKLKSLNFR